MYIFGLGNSNKAKTRKGGVCGGKLWFWLSSALLGPGSVHQVCIAVPGHYDE